MDILPRNERGAMPLLLLITVIGLIGFFVISSVAPFRNNIFSALFPKKTSQAANGIENPTRLAIIYVHPKDRYSGVEFSTADIAKKFNVVVYHRQFDNKIRDLRNAGFKGEALQYIIHDETAGPQNMSAPWAQTTVCNSTQKSFSPAWHQSITYKPGSFCEIHDSIVNKTPFDHDLNSETPSVVASEDWFLHDSSGNRIVQPEGMPGGSFYRVNPGNQHWREYFITRSLIEVKGGTNHAKTNFDGVFLDNIQLGWHKLKRNVNHGTVKEYSSEEVFSNDVYEFVRQMYLAFHSNGNNYPLWGNMIEGNNNGWQWDRYISSLDGGLLEDWVLNWGNGYHADQTIMNQFTQAEKWLAAGKDYVAVVQGNSSNSNHDAWGRFSLAAFLLVTDGLNGSFHHASNATYGPHFDYPEYYYKLGKPLEARQETSSNPRIISRNFECGKVEVNLSAKTSSINYISGCVPSQNSNPITVPIRIDSASLTPSATSTIDQIGSTLLNTFSDTPSSWVADIGFVGGNVANRGAVEIQNTDDDFIYQTERWGVNGYSLNIPNGNYTVKLHFAETWTGITTVNQRIFSVMVENQSINDLDVFAEAGGLNKALIKTVPVTVSDGVLNITFIKKSLETMISGIEVLNNSEVTPAPTSEPTQIPTPTLEPTPVPTPSPTPLPTPIPTLTPTPVPTPTPMVHVMPSAPTITKNIGCINQNYSGNGITVSWASAGSNPVTWIDISSSSNFSSFYHKNVSGSPSTQLPVGFTLNNGTQALVLNPNTTYYVRLYNNSPTGGHSPISSFSLTQCVTAGSTIKIDASGTRGNNGLYAIMELRIDQKIVKTFRVNGTLQGYTYTTPTKVNASQIKVAFWEDDGPRDLRVTGITVDGAYYPTASTNVYYYSPICKMNGFNVWKADTLWCNGDLSYR
jgi:hypothetical protein